MKNKCLHAGKQITKKSTQLCWLVLIAANMKLIFDVINIQKHEHKFSRVLKICHICQTLRLLNIIYCRFSVAFDTKELHWNLWNKSIWVLLVFFMNSNQFPCSIFRIKKAPLIYIKNLNKLGNPIVHLHLNPKNYNYLSLN